VQALQLTNLESSSLVRCGKHEQKLFHIIIIIIIIIIIFFFFFIIVVVVVFVIIVVVGRDSVVGIATTLRARLSENRIPVGARFSTPVQTGPGAHPASYTMGTRSLPGFYKQVL